MFTPTAHQVAPGSIVTTGITITDVTNHGTSITDAVTSIIATAANTTPAIAGTAANQAVSDTSRLTPFAGATISDAAFGAQETVTLALSAAANGTLSGTGLTASGGGVYTLAAGSPAAVSTALDALVFTPTSRQVAPGSTVTTGITITDVTNHGTSTTDSATSVIATASNGSAPVIAGTAAGQTVTDSATLTPFATTTTTITDAAFGAQETVTLALSAAANGTLSGTGLTALGGGVYRLAAGSPAAVSTALDALVFTPTAHQVAPGSIVTTGITITDVTNHGISATDAITSVVATAANATPSIAGTAANQAVSDISRLTPFGGTTITDAAFGAQETLTLALSAAANGTLSGTGLTAVGGGVYTLAAGSPAAVSTALDALVFTPTAHQVAPGSIVTTGITITDATNHGTTTTNTAALIVTTATNDTPVISTLANARSTTDSAPILPFAGIGISDPDTGATETATITLTASGKASDANGTLSGPGLTRTGAGTYQLIENTPAATAAGLRALVFTPTVRQVLPGGRVTTDFTLSLVQSVGANTTPAVVASTTISAGAGVLPFANVALSSSTGTQTVTVAAQLLGGAAGMFSQLGTGTLSSDGASYVVTGTAADVQAALQNVVFVPTTSGTVSNLVQAVLLGAASNVTLADNGQVGDVLVANGGSDVLAAGSGASTLIGGSGSLPPTLFGGAGGTTVFDGGSSALIVGGSQHDVVVATGAATTILGGAGGSLFGLGAGNTFVETNGADTVAAGTGIDIVLNNGGSGVLLGGGSAQTLFFAGGGISTVVGGQGSTTVVGGTGGGLFAGGSAGNKLLAAGHGSTTLFGAASGDVLLAQGSAGDVLVAGAGNETLGGNSTGADRLFAGSGADVLIAGSGWMLSHCKVTARGPSRPLLHRRQQPALEPKFS